MKRRAERRRAARSTTRSPKRLVLTPQEIAACDGASDGDRDWFNVHRDRSHRIRPAIAFELPGLAIKQYEGSWIVVRQLPPGVRARLWFCSEDQVPDVEPVAHAVFDLLLERGFDPVSFGTIAARALAMCSGGLA